MRKNSSSYVCLPVEAVNNLAIFFVIKKSRYKRGHVLKFNETCFNLFMTWKEPLLP